MIKKDCLYIPDPTEPNIFTPIDNGISLDWVCWAIHHKKTGVKSADFKIDFDVFAEPSHQERHDFLEIYNLSIEVHKTVTHSVTPPQAGEYILPDEPPLLYIDRPGRKSISMAWIMDTCIRDNMSPKEATVLAYALAKM